MASIPPLPVDIPALSWGGMVSKALHFDAVAVPPGLRRMIDDPRVATFIGSGSYVYVLDQVSAEMSTLLVILKRNSQDGVDAGWAESWQPRALPRWRGEVDEGYNKGNVRCDSNVNHAPHTFIFTIFHYTTVFLFYFCRVSSFILSSSSASPS